MRRALAALLLALTPGASGADLAEAGARLDPARSEASFSVRMRWLQTFHGRFERFDGRVQALPDGRRRVAVALEADSLDFGGTGRINDWARSDEFFHVSRHPMIAFDSKPFDAALVRDGGELRGELELRGVRREVGFEVLPAECPAPGVDCPIRLRGEVSRRAFGMTAHPFAVLDRVRLSVDVYLRRES